MSHLRRPRALLAAVALATAAALALPASALAAPRTAPRATTPHAALGALSAPRLPSGARVLGAVAPSTHLVVGVALQPRNPAALSAFAAAVSDVHSRLFRHYLERGQFAARFGPTSATIHAVERYFQGEGLRVAGLTPNHLIVSLAGSAGQFATAFHTQLQSVRLAGGALGRRTVGALAVPHSIAPAVASVIGLDRLTAPQPLLRFPKNQLRRPTTRGIGRSFTTHPRGTPGAPSACAAATGVTQPYGGITDDQVASAYGADGLYGQGDLGAGQTVAIFELEPFAMSDLQIFDRCYFGADHSSQVKVVDVDGGAGVGPGSGEAILDVETVSALAPSADIDVYEAPLTTYGLIDEYSAIVSSDTAQVVSTSWGLCEQDEVSGDPGQLVAENVLFEQAAAQGQTVFAAAGDDGNDDCGNAPPEKPLVGVDDPASQPYVVGVGGTTAISVAQPPAQQVWNDGDGGGAGGGGISTLWTATPWQRAAAGSKTNASTCGAGAGQVCRPVPDVSAFADEYTGITIYYGSSLTDVQSPQGNDGAWYTIGGTSMAAPIWAAMLAEINASSACTGNSVTRKGVGYAAPLLYDVASNPTDYASAFTDVVTGNNDILQLTGGKYAATTGYDLASGLGTPELTPAEGVSGPGLATALCAAAQGATTATVSTVTPSVGAVGGGTPFTITGTGFYSNGSPDVEAVDFGNAQASSFTVQSNTEITGTTGPDTDTASTTLAKLNHKSGTVLVTVTTDDGSVARGPTFRYDSQSAGKDVPVVLQVGPSGGRGSGGTKVAVYGSAFLGATKVTFGGVSAAFSVRNDNQLTATAPSDAHVHCAVALKSSFGVCQVEVQVTGPGGTSAAAGILKPYAGFLETNAVGTVIVPKNCKCESYPSATEYDYVTKLSITKIVGPNGNATEPDAYGGDVLAVEGTGLNILTVNWVNIGPPSLDTSQAIGDLFVFGANGTSLELFSPGDPAPSDKGNSASVTVDSVAGLSNAKSLAFGPIQQVDSVSSEVAPSAGGATIVLHGGGFVKVQEVIWASATGGGADQYGNFTVNSASEITLKSPSLPPGSYEIGVCGAYGCGGLGLTDPSYATDTVSVNYPGETVVTSAEASNKPPAGSTAGGSIFEIQGANFGPLGSVTVEFVNQLDETVTDAATVSAGPSPTDPGATETLLVTAPAAFDGLPQLDALVVTGADGTSPINVAALYTYNSP